GVLDTLQVSRRDALDFIASQNVPFGQQALVGALVVQVSLHFLAAKNVLQTLQPFVGENSNLVRKVLLELRYLRGFDRLRALVLLLAFAGEDFHVNNHALNSRWAVERSIANVSSLLTEDGAQQFFFRGELCLALGRDLSYQNVALLHARADANYARF